MQEGFIEKKWYLLMTKYMQYASINEFGTYFMKCTIVISNICRIVVYKYYNSLNIFPFL